jgi:hypothetical protein
VKLAEQKSIPLDKLTLEDLKTLDPHFEADVMNLWSYENRCFYPAFNTMHVLPLYQRNSLFLNFILYITYSTSSN